MAQADVEEFAIMIAGDDDALNLYNVQTGEKIKTLHVKKYGAGFCRMCFAQRQPLT